MVDGNLLRPGVHVKVIDDLSRCRRKPPKEVLYLSGKIVTILDSYDKWNGETVFYIEEDPCNCTYDGHMDNRWWWLPEWFDFIVEEEEPQDITDEQFCSILLGVWDRE